MLSTTKRYFLRLGCHIFSKFLLGMGEISNMHACGKKERYFLFLKFCLLFLKTEQWPAPVYITVTDFSCKPHLPRRLIAIFYFKY